MSCTESYWIFFYICDICSCCLKLPSCICLPRYSLPVKDVAQWRMSQRCRWKHRLFFIGTRYCGSASNTSIDHSPLFSFTLLPKERMQLVRGAAGSKVCWPAFVMGWMSRSKVSERGMNASDQENAWGMEAAHRGRVGRGTRSQSTWAREGNPPVFRKSPTLLHLHVCFQILLLSYLLCNYQWICRD